jgi:hypothetical protein
LFRYAESHVFKVSQPRTVRPLDYHQAGKLSLSDLTGEKISLVYLPGLDPQEIADLVNHTFERIPPEPSPDPLLKHNDVQRIKLGRDPDEGDICF